MSNWAKEKYTWLIPLIAGLISIIVWFFYSKDFGVFVQIIIFVAIFWYSFETRELKTSSKLSNELEQKPIVDFFYRPAIMKHGQYLRLRNSGKGIAYNIEVETIKEENKSFEFYFEDPNLILTPGDEQTLLVNAKYKDERGGETWPGDALGYFLGFVKEKTWKNRDNSNVDLLTEKQKIKLVVSYENAVSQKLRRIFYIYEQITKTDNKKEYEVEFYKEEIL